MPRAAEARRAGKLTGWVLQVTSQLGLLPRHELQVPQNIVDEESDANAK